jgi:signal transduction histidine kinase
MRSESGLAKGRQFKTAALLEEEHMRLFTVLLPMLLLIGVGAIAVILALSAFFTNRLSRVVMEPVEKLLLGVERIRNGNLEEEIDYQGEAEFEQVCRAFNSMQHTILEDQRQRARNEQARTDMVTGISHDLRTPLTSIRGYIKGVLDGIAGSPEKKEAYLRTAYEATEEMNVLLQKLFDFSRMESGQMPFHMVRADLAEFVAAYVAQKEMRADADMLQFLFAREREQIVEIDMDVEQVRRILDNLLENSEKYAQVKPVQVQIRLEERHNSVFLEWKDNGKGVPEEKRERIFDRFYRCDEARNEKGSGIGLYVVRYIMERHGGTATAYNDGGLVIRLEFPKENADDEDIDC